MADKRDLNTPVSSSDADVLPGGLGERQARSYRPARAFHRGTAVAVVGSDGSAVGATLESLMEEVLYELRALRLGMTLAGTAEQVDIDEEL